MTFRQAGAVGSLGLSPLLPRRKLLIAGETKQSSVAINFNLFRHDVIRASRATIVCFLPHFPRRRTENPGADESELVCASLPAPCRCWSVTEPLKEVLNFSTQLEYPCIVLKI